MDEFTHGRVIGKRSLTTVRSVLPKLLVSINLYFRDYGNATFERRMLVEVL